MTLAVPPEKKAEFLALAKTRDVEATVIGSFTDSGKFQVLYDNKTVAYLSMDFLHKGLPTMKLNARWAPRKFDEPVLGVVDLAFSLKTLLSRLNICSKEYVIRQYDHEVQEFNQASYARWSKRCRIIRPLLDSMEGGRGKRHLPKYGDIDISYDGMRHR
jgi:phosphoribosylformylglycinamidine synthase